MFTIKKNTYSLRPLNLLANANKGRANRKVGKDEAVNISVMKGTQGEGGSWRFEEQIRKRVLWGVWGV